MGSPVLAPSQSVEVTLALFGGTDTEISPSDLPEGLSPDNQDMVYAPGGTYSRPCLKRLFANPFPNGVSVLYQKTYVQPNNNPLTLVLSSDGRLWVEDVVNAPLMPRQIGSVPPGLYAQSVSAFGREYIAFSDLLHGQGVPLQFDGTFLDRVSQDGPGAAPTAADSPNAGSVAIGVHQVVVMFLTRQGYLTKPSPLTSWNAAGGKKVLLTNLPIGPSNVVARVLGFTGAGGGNFFSILANVTIPAVVNATIVFDNISTQATLDFSDNALFASVAIDQIGNDLFDQVVLGPCLGFFSYASRLVAWGDWTKVENFLNLGFCGGYLAGALAAPLGWNSGGNAGGTLVNGGPWAGGMCWQILGDGSANQRGLLSQPAALDAFGIPIISPNTQYGVRLWAQPSAANLAGNLFITLSSASSGFNCFAQVPIATLNASGGFCPLTQFNLKTPAFIPADLTLSLYEIGLNAGATVLVAEFEFIFVQNPYRSTEARVSYVENPEAFAQTTGNIGASDDQSPIQNFSLQRNVGLLHTGEATHEFQDNNFEPGDGQNAWPVNALTHSVGALSLRACDPGKFGTGDSAEDWDIIASENGLYLHIGAAFYRLSQAMMRTLTTAPAAFTWDDINRAAKQTVWVKNDVNKHRALIGVPVNGATQPNLIFVFDYREMDTATQVSSSVPLHITLAGKMKSSDLTHKWSRWNIAANSADILVRPGNARDIFLGGGKNANGQAFGNVYSLDPTKLTDDDYGQMAPYYVTYAFVDHDQEIALGLGSGRHFYKKVNAFITGVGLVTVQAFINSLLNPYPISSPRLLQADTSQGSAQGSDLEWTQGIHGQRVFFKIAVTPLAGTTDVQLKLEKFMTWIQKDPIAIWRGMGI